MGTNTGLENDRHRYNNYWDSHTSFTSPSLPKNYCPFFSLGAFGSLSFLKARGRELSSFNYAQLHLHFSFAQTQFHIPVKRLCLFSFTNNDITIPIKKNFNNDITIK